MTDIDNMDMVFVDAETMARIKAAQRAMNNAESDDFKEYWWNVIQALINGSDTVGGNNVVDLASYR
jgi:hypothetical protein